MKITQEQIEAALNWLQWLDDDRFGNFEKEPHGARQILRPCKRGDYETLETTSSRILAAAYREKCEECEMMQIRYAAAEMHHASQIEELSKASLRLAHVAEQNTDDTELWESVIDDVRKLAKP